MLQNPQETNPPACTPILKDGTSDDKTGMEKGFLVKVFRVSWTTFIKQRHWNGEDTRKAGVGELGREVRLGSSDFKYLLVFFKAIKKIEVGQTKEGTFNPIS